MKRPTFKWHFFFLRLQWWDDIAIFFTFIKIIFRRDYQMMMKNKTQPVALQDLEAKKKGKKWDARLISWCVCVCVCGWVGVCVCVCVFNPSQKTGNFFLGRFQVWDAGEGFFFFLFKKWLGKKKWVRTGGGLLDKG